MREHQMNEYQCPFCLHGEAEKERLLSHLLNCHPGRPGKVLLRKQMTANTTGGTSNTPSIMSSPPPPPQPPTSDPGHSKGGNFSTKQDAKQPEQKADGVSSSGLPGGAKEGVQVRCLMRNSVSP